MGKSLQNQAKNDCCKLLGILSQQRGKLALTKSISLSSALLRAPPRFPQSQSLRKGAAGNRLQSFSSIFITAPGRVQGLKQSSSSPNAFCSFPPSEEGCCIFNERPSSAPNVLASQHTGAASTQWLSGNIILPKSSALAMHFHTSINFIMVSL